MPLKRVALPVGVFAAVICVMLTLAVVGALGSGATAEAMAPVCATHGPLDGLSTAQAENARTVVAISLARGGDPAALVALTVGLTESGLLSLGNANVSDAAGLPVQGVGSDHDSLGIFQQRTGWGTAAQRLDPTTSTKLFLDALLAVPAWRAEPPWIAAQQVQRSAYDGSPSSANHYSGTVGGNYLAQLDQATAILTQIRSAAPTPDCGASDAGLPPTGPQDAFGLPVAFVIPPNASPPERLAISLALAQRGKPYQWGATGPDRFDCSGLVQWAWAAAGVLIGRVTTQQVRDGTPSSTATILPGDLVLTPGSDGTLAAPGHVGMYIGSGLVVNAPHTGDVVRVVTLTSFTASGMSAVRHIG